MTPRCACCHAPRPLIDADWSQHLCGDCKDNHARLHNINPT